MTETDIPHRDENECETESGACEATMAALSEIPEATSRVLCDVDMRSCSGYAKWRGISKVSGLLGPVVCDRHRDQFDTRYLQPGEADFVWAPLREVRDAP